MLTSSNAAGTAPEAPLKLGDFADYELLSEVGHGGMGVVHQARQKGLGRIVALKMLLGGQFAEASARARFRTEAEIAAQLQHPNIVAIHEVGEQDHLPFFSMDCVKPGSLQLPRPDGRRQTGVATGCMGALGGLVAQPKANQSGLWCCITSMERSAKRELEIVYGLRTRRRRLW